MDQCPAYQNHSIDCFEAYFDEFTATVGCASHSSSAAAPVPVITDMDGDPVGIGGDIEAYHESMGIPPVQEDFDCRFYPRCSIGMDLLYCPKKAGKRDCDEYISMTQHDEQIRQEAAAKERAEVLDALNEQCERWLSNTQASRLALANYRMFQRKVESLRGEQK